MMRAVKIVAVVTLVLLATPRLGAQKLGLYETMARPILAPDQPAVEVKTYTASRVPPLPLLMDRAGLHCPVMPGFRGFS